MASISRSFRSPPSYLSPRRRPTMAGRTLSNSSERSWASDCDEGDRTGTGAGSDVATSGRTTPVHIRRFGPQAHANTATESSPSPSARGEQKFTLVFLFLFIPSVYFCVCAAYPPSPLKARTGRRRARSGRRTDVSPVCHDEHIWVSAWAGIRPSPKIAPLVLLPRLHQATHDHAQVGAVLSSEASIYRIPPAA
jgi:hypothetical protein